jgi:hypothetical protein
MYYLTLGINYSKSSHSFISRLPVSIIQQQASEAFYNSYRSVLSYKAKRIALLVRNDASHIFFATVPGADCFAIAESSSTSLEHQDWTMAGQRRLWTCIKKADVCLRRFIIASISNNLVALDSGAQSLARSSLSSSRWRRTL